MLEWSEEREPNKECAYHHVVSKTPLGELRIEWKGWKERPCFDITTPWWGYWVLAADTVEEAKAAVQQRWDAMAVGPRERWSDPHPTKEPSAPAAEVEAATKEAAAAGGTSHSARRPGGAAG